MIGQRCSLSLPIVLYIFNILQQCSLLPCLTIDNRIAVTANDCYTRISIGSKLSDVNIVSRIVVASLTECEDQCSKNGNTCNAFTFGVDPNGNGTCATSTRIPMLQDLETHTDYDVYVKKRQASPWCNVDRLYQDFTTLGNGHHLMKIERPNKEGLVTNIYGNSYSKGKDDYTAGYGLVGIYDLFINHDGRFPSGDDNRRVLDILANRNRKPASSSPFVTICHRKLQPGKKMVELLIERVLTCENVQDCRRACDYEKAFACKGFNHRRGTNGSKDTCELTSTPYFRMNVDRDFLIDYRYDYYEKDRTCLSSLRRGDIARWMDRVKVYGQNRQDTWSPLDREGTSDDLARQPTISTGLSFYRELYPTDRQFIRSFTDEHERSNGQYPQENRRDFASRQNAPKLSWNGNWRGPESRYTHTVNDVNSLHGPPINYNEEHSSTRSSTLSKSRLGDRSDPRGFFTPQKDEHFSRKFYDYGIAFGYNDDNYVPSTKEFPYGEQKKLPVTSKCSIRLAAGSKLSRNVIRKTCLARDSRQCEDFCVNEITFSCGSFAYRYNLVTTNPTDNCLLSDLPYRDVNFYTDLEPDRDYDSYIISDDSKICHSKPPTSRYSSEECFLRVRSGFGIPMDITKKSMLVDDLGGCQFACKMSQEFVCRSFAFQYATEYRDPAHQEPASPNCFLSDWPSVGINPVDMPDVDGAELYERVSIPYGCEVYPLPLPITGITEPNDKESATVNMDEICYSQYHRPCKLMPHAIVSSTRAATKSECCQKCSTMRNIGSIPCMSFNYMITTTVDTRDNCLLSVVPVRDLRPNLDYTYDDDHVLYMWKDLDPCCSLTVNPFNSPSAAAVPEEHDEPFSPSPSQMSAQGVRDTGTGSFQRIFDSVPSTRGKLWHENYECEYKRNHETYNYDTGPRLVSDGFEHRFGSPYPRDLSIFRRYTVNGHPCKNGSVCQRNEIAGFWSCEIEENEDHRHTYGGTGLSWDYCCEPNHRCGFSQGYRYPWCYVGSNDDQWRPCSETYHPYPYYLPLPKDYHSLNSQLSAYSGRHWPIIYLHETLPPNCTVGRQLTPGNCP